MEGCDCTGKILWSSKSSSSFPFETQLQKQTLLKTNGSSDPSEDVTGNSNKWQAGPPPTQSGNSVALMPSLKKFPRRECQTKPIVPTTERATSTLWSTTNTKKNTVNDLWGYNGMNWRKEVNFSSWSWYLIVHSCVLFSFYFIIRSHLPVLLLLEIPEKTGDFVKPPSLDFHSKIINLSSLRRDKSSLRRGMLPLSCCHNAFCCWRL